MCRCKESLEKVARIAELIHLHHSGFLPSTSTYLNGKEVSVNNAVVVFTVIVVDDEFLAYLSVLLKTFPSLCVS